MLKVVKADGKMDLESLKKQVPTLPEPRQAPLLATVANCEKKLVENTDDKCELAFMYAECMYKDNPEVSTAYFHKIRFE